MEVLAKLFVAFCCLHPVKFVMLMGASQYFLGHRSPSFYGLIARGGLTTRIRVKTPGLSPMWKALHFIKPRHTPLDSLRTACVEVFLDEMGFLWMSKLTCRK